MSIGMYVYMRTFAYVCVCVCVYIYTHVNRTKRKLSDAERKTLSAAFSDGAVGDRNTT